MKKNLTIPAAIIAFLLTFVLAIVIGRLVFGSGEDTYPAGMSADKAVAKLADDTITPAVMSADDFDTVAADVCSASAELVDKTKADAPETQQALLDAARESIETNDVSIQTDFPEDVAGTIAGLSVTYRCPQNLTVPVV